MDVARTSMLHAAAPHFLWPFAVRYAAHQINLHPRVSRPETSPSLTVDGEGWLCVGVPGLGSRVFVRDLSADKLSPRAAPCVFLGFPLVRAWVDAVEPVEVTGDSGAAGCAEPGGVGRGGAESGGAEHGGTASREVLRLGVLGVEVLRLEVLRVLLLAGSHSLHKSCASGLPDAGAGTAGAGGSSAAEGAAVAGPGGARTGSTGAAGPTGSTELVLLRVLALRLPAGGPTGGCSLVLLEVLLERVLLLRVLVLSLLRLASLSRHSHSYSLPPLCLLLLPTLVLLEVLLSDVSLRLVLRSPVRAARASGRSSCQRPPPVPGTHRMSLASVYYSSACPFAFPPESSLLHLPTLESDSLRAASPTVTRLLATVVTDPSFESTAASALVTELVDFAARCRLDYAASLVAESESVCPPSVGGECTLSTDVLEDTQEEFQWSGSCFTSSRVCTCLPLRETRMHLTIPTPRSYAEAIEGPYSSQWQAAMDAEMASWKSTGTYVDAVPPPGRTSQRQGVDYFQTFSPTSKMTTLRVLLHIAAHRDYELHSLDFSTTFLQGSLHEEIWLRRPPGFTGSFPPGTQWSLRRPVYGLRQAPRKWHDTLRTTLAALGFAPSTADPSLFLRTDTSLPPFYILVYVDDLVFATADTAGLAYVKSELQKRHTCTDLGELRSYLGLQITRDRARRTITLTQSTHGAAGPSALRLHVLLASGHSSAYSPLTLSSAFG
ncbi:unnamed protein product [Closterium sp. NIES-64]|nr:unnamed protein product [Closterium sp. NIES-64]